MSRRARLAAGRTFTTRTLKAGWAARFSHTSVVDAAGAIFVIGGFGGANTDYADVWASTDGGARAGLRRGVLGLETKGALRGVLQGYYRGTKGTMLYRGYAGCTQGTPGVLRGTREVL